MLIFLIIFVTLLLIFNIFALIFWLVQMKHEAKTFKKWEDDRVSRYFHSTTK